ncbi:MAG: carbohydrate binding domain-containing protein [Elusimicrobiota bacterium]
MKKYNNKWLCDYVIKWLVMTLLIHLSTYPLIHCLYSEDFDIDEWNQIRQQKEKKEFKEEQVETANPEAFRTSTPTITSEPIVPPILSEGIELPYESKLAISGRKFIGMNFTTSKYLHKRDDKKTQPTATGFELTQQLQVRVKGTVKRKITVNVDYDDTVENKKDISIMYRGDPDELVQEAAFGDITLSLPGTEFVSYGKAAFGAMAKLKHKKANFYGVFSRTKGTTETKRFRGSTTFEKKDINDTNYLRRKYYELALSTAHLPITPGSEKIYVDDKNATNNTILTSTISVSQYGVAAGSSSATCDLLYPGNDYTIDYERGVIVFRKSISQNYVIAVDYEKKDGTRVINDLSVGSYKLIKDETETLTQELKNYYSIGRTKIIRDDNRGNFILKVMDLSRKDTPEIAKYPDNVEVDFEAGIFRFTDGSGNDKSPFPTPTTYATSPTRNYIIYTEYRYRAKSYLVRANIVPQSEKIVMDGQPLIRDIDYFMDYDSGFITFLNEEKINDTTLIDIIYEWAPFGGQMDQTVVGTRVEYVPYNNFSFGSTFLYNFPAKPLTSPDVHSTPESISVCEFDTKVSLINLPLQPAFSGEYASSVRNPNIFGNALIENMEGIKQADTMSSDDESWKYSANLSAAATVNGSIYWTNVDVKRSEINSSVPDDEKDSKQQVINISYKLLNTHQEASIIYSISRLGTDYTKKLFLDFWMNGDSSGDEITFSIGSLNEDADGDGVMDTEDKNSDGVLNPGEDIGIVFDHPDGSITTIGADNGKIDTEDLDGDGVLRRNDNLLGSFSMAAGDGFKDESGTNHTNIDWTGWKHLSVPLGVVTTWETVKQIKLTVESPSGNSSYRTMQFADISIVGNKWEKPVVTGTDEMTATAINNIDNTNYTPLYSYFPQVFRELYNLESVDLEGKKEQALQLSYTIADGSTATTKSVFSRAADYSKHKELTYYLWGGDNSKGATFAIQFGAESAYYEHKITPDWVGWKKIMLHFVDINKDSKPDKIVADEGEGIVTPVGNPSLTNISQIKVIVRNETGAPIANGEMWLDEIYLDDSWKITGYANRYNSDFNIPNWATFGGKFKFINRDFQTLTTQISNRDYEEISGYFGMPQLWLLKPEFLGWLAVPLNTSVSKTVTVTPSAIQTGDSNLVSILEEGKVITISGNSSSSITIQKFPRLGASFSRSISESNALIQRDETNTANCTFDYTNPLKLYVTPNDLSASYSRSDAFRGRPMEKAVDFPDLFNFTTNWYLQTYSDDYSGRTSFMPIGWLDDWFGVQPFSNLSLTPSYRFSVVHEKKRLIGEIETDYPKNDSQTASLSTSFRIFLWLSPAASYNSGITQTYNLTTSTVPRYEPLYGNVTGFIDSKTKTVVRTSGGNISISLSPRDIVNFAPINSLSLNSSFEIADGDSYKNVNKEEYVYNKFFVREKLWEKSLLVRNLTTGSRESLTLSDTIRGNARYSPFEFLGFGGRLSPIKSVTTASAYSKTDRKSETTGTQSQTITTNWPDLTAGIVGTEKFFFIEKYVSDTQVNLRYTNRTTDDYAFSERMKFAQTTSNSYDYRFNVIKRFDCSTSYSVTKIFAKDIKQDKVTADGKVKSVVVQFGYRPLAYNYKDWRFTPRYEMQTNFEVDGTPKITKNSTTQIASLGITYDVSKPSTFSIPFILKKQYNYQSRLTTNGNLKYSQTNDKIVALNNAEIYSFTLTGDCAISISDNLRFNLTPGGTYSVDKKKKKDDYYSMQISSSLTIMF